MKKLLYIIFSIFPLSCYGLTLSENLSVELLAGADKRLKLTPEDHNKKQFFYGINGTYSTKYLTLNTIIIDDKKVGGFDEKLKSLALTYTSQSNHPLTVSVGRIIIPFGVYEIQRVYATAISQRTLNDSLWNSIIGSRVIEPSNNGIFIKKEISDNIALTVAGYTPTPASNQRFDSITTNIVDPASLTQVNTPSNRDINNVDSRRNLNNRANETRDTINVVPGTGTSAATNLILTGDIENNLVNNRKSRTSANKIFIAGTYDNRDDLIIDIEKVISKTDISLNGKQFEYNEEYNYAAIQKRFFRRLYFILEGASYKSRSVDGIILRDRVTGINLSYDSGGNFLYQAFLSRANGDTVNISDFSIGGTYSFNYTNHLRVLYRKTDGEFNNQLPRVCDAVCRQTINPDEPTFSVAPIGVRASGLEVRFLTYF